MRVVATIPTDPDATDTGTVSCIVEPDQFLVARRSASWARPAPPAIRRLAPGSDA